MCQILTSECKAHPPTCVNLTKLWEDSTFEWPLNRPSFSLILKLSHALCGLLSVLTRLHGRKHKRMHFLLNEAHFTKVTIFGYCCLGFFAWNPLFIFRNRCFDGHYPSFGKYIFPQLQTCSPLVLSPDCTEGCCSSNHNIVIFNNFFSF